MELTYKLCAFVVVLLIQSPSMAASQLSYESLEQLNASCTPRDTCQSHNSRSRILLSLSERSCACDNQCPAYDDCCIDFKGPRDGQLPMIETWSCERYGGLGSFYVKANCPVDWREGHTKKLCEGRPDASDPVSGIPVTVGLGVTEPPVTYKNAHCALCNGVSTEKQLYWGLRVQCDGLDVYNSTYGNLTAEFIQDNLVYLELEKQWALVLTYPYLCEVSPVPPEPVLETLRICHENLVKECPDEWADDHVREACASYQAIVYTREAKAKKFRNAHCAQCNGHNTTGLLCLPMASREAIIGRNRPLNAFSILLDMNPGQSSASGHSSAVGHKHVCSGQSQVYDPFFKRCRTLVCDSDKFTLVNGTCVTVMTDDKDDGKEDGDVDGENGITETDSDLTPTETYDDMSTNVIDTNESSEEEVKDKDGGPSSPSSSCPKVSLDKNSFFLLKNGSVYVTLYNTLFNEGNYTLDANGQLLICPPFALDSAANKFPELLGYLTQLGLSVSIACLVLHLVIFLIVPEMRNLSGRNLSSMALCLLIGYISFIVAQQPFVYSDKGYCITAAVMIYYFFLASFMWMNVMAFDVWRTLSLATSELRVSSGRQQLRFLVYATYSWLLSGLIVSIALWLDMMPGTGGDLDQFRPGFGVDNKCWFTSRKSLVVFFALPVGLVMLFNVVFFTLTSCIILTTTNGTMSANGHKSPAQRNFKLYARLTILAGLTWITGFLASYVDNDYLWAVFIVLNTMQGVFIFVSFTCSKKIRKSTRDKLSDLMYTKTRTTTPELSGSGQSRSFGTGLDGHRVLLFGLQVHLVP
ncbi:G-protein coupled receptor Mth2 [Halotydeus destructor]|nr:G-protein coupled receptor Mth2 [Halotydeus destructor]